MADEQGQQTADRIDQNDGATAVNPSFDDQQGQDFFNSAFASQIGASLPQGLNLVSQIFPALFDEFERNQRTQREAVEHSLRTLRRTTEVWTQQMILTESRQAIVQAVVPVVCRQVIDQMKRDPQWQEYLRRQVEQYNTTKK